MGMTVPSYYPAIVELAAEGVGGFFPDLPGCTTAGATMQEAARNAEDALQAHIDLAAEHHDPIPRPSEIDASRWTLTSGKRPAFSSVPNFPGARYASTLPCRRSF